MDKLWTPNVVIYHDHCADGFAAAWACWLRWGDACQYVATNYGQPAPDVAGKHVLIVDFSYKRDVLAGMNAASMIVLDHHKTAQAELAELPSVDGDIDDSGDWSTYFDPIARFDMEKSGARLAWEFCHPGVEPPLLIQLVEDRDLWRFALPETKAFSLWLRSEPFSFERFEQLAQELNDARDHARIMAEAEAMQRFHDARVEEIASFARRRRVGEHEAVVVNCPPMFASEVGNALLDRHPGAPFAATYFDGPNSRMWSLRSRDDRVDVSAVAARFGGGGHRNAAGFSVPL